MKILSFVIPCYRSEFTIEKVVDEIRETVGQREGYDYEIIAVNDCSPDNVYDVLTDLARKDERIKVVNFAKNMGKHAAVLAGYAVVQGEYVVNLDDDYQSPVDQLWDLLELVENDECDCATAEYTEKKESWLKRKGSDLNMYISNVLIDKPKNIRTENFSVTKAFVVKEMIKYKNPYPYLEGLLFSVTNRVKTVRMNQRERGDSKASGFTLLKSISLAVNGMTAFSVKPLRIASMCGLLFAVFGFFYGIFIVVNKILNPALQAGYSSLMAVILFSAGLIMLMLGLIGEYLGRIYICLNDSPQYVIKNTINLDEEENECNNNRSK